jgi:hypothetical protein
MGMQYEGYRPRPPGLPLIDGKVDFTNEAGVQQMLELIGDAPLPDVSAAAAEPFVGVTTDGHAIPGLFPLADDGFDGAPAARAAIDFLHGLTAAERAKSTSPMDSTDWRLWINAFLTFPEHGLRLQDLSDSSREAALAVIEASTSTVGFERIRKAMRLNGELGRFVDSYFDTLTEWCYWFTIFGEPSADAPWGWQLAGHHIDVHCAIIGHQVVLTPTFLGAEFRSAEIFAEHRASALEFMQSLSAGQRKKAVLFESLSPGELPKALAGHVDGRHRSGAGQDNLVMPYEGLRGDQLSAGQRELLLSVLDPYIDGLSAGPRTAWQRQVAKHLDDSWFTWIGNDDDRSPFYYKVHSPVILVEYDNHSGIFLDNETPEPFHVHSIVRTPNGGDYGKDLLAQHYAQQHTHDHDHSHGDGHGHHHH